MTDTQINAAIADLIHTTDGPVTPFVILSRAMELAAAGRHSPDALANAAYEALALGDEILATSTEY